MLIGSAEKEGDERTGEISFPKRGGLCVHCPERRERGGNGPVKTKKGKKNAVVIDRGGERGKQVL